MPTHSDFVLTADEIRIIQLITLPDGGVDWDHDDFVPVRRRIRGHFLTVTRNLCAYCQRSLAGESPGLIDVEHILPKGRFPTLAVVPLNLTVACRRCNVTVKARRWSFVHGRSRDAALDEYHRSETYEIVHPNLDDMRAHIRRFVVQDGADMAIFYLATSDKGRTTHGFFKLREIEVRQLDEMQGAAPTNEEIALQVEAIFGR